MKKGFTLIELLVVMTIIAILATIGFAAYEASQSSARDSKRKQDIDALASALEQKYNPITNSYSPLGNSSFQAGLPKDPKDKDSFVYTFAVDGGGVFADIPTTSFKSYAVCAKLDAGKGGNASDRNGTSASGDSAPYYCNTNLQGSPLAQASAGGGGGSSGGSLPTSCQDGQTAGYKDFDCDGYGVSGTAGCYDPNSTDYCIADNSNDCDDTDINVYPGQTQYFSALSNSGTFDYNCSGILEKDPGLNCQVSLTACTQGGAASVHAGYLDQIPTCGQSAAFRNIGRNTTNTCSSLANVSQTCVAVTSCNNSNYACMPVSTANKKMKCR